MNFTDLLDEYLDAKAVYDAELEKFRESGSEWYYFENSYSATRMIEAREAMNRFMESRK